MRSETAVPPQVGIFWFVVAGVTHMLSRGCPLDAAEAYGDCLTFPDGHAEVWEAWRKRALPLPVPALGPVIAATEYEVWPRGRIVYERTQQRFVIYSDAQLLLPRRLDRIRADFGLLGEVSVGRTDWHYTRATRLPDDAEA
ncbi:hypothetical protein ACFQS7_00015 [Dankookia sp. GCM10030260]|uniref:hypothetical protein n=1 Tax=Dankookia sp. GCM10030260 TaxID=3273390 RepID=UPI00360FC1AA